MFLSGASLRPQSLYLCLSCTWDYRMTVKGLKRLQNSKRLFQRHGQRADKDARKSLCRGPYEKFYKLQVQSCQKQIQVTGSLKYQFEVDAVSWAEETAFELGTVDRG
jgi:hypothetical protein